MFIVLEDARDCAHHQNVILGASKSATAH